MSSYSDQVYDDMTSELRARIAELETHVRFLANAAYRDGCTALVSATALNEALALVGLPPVDGRMPGDTTPSVSAPTKDWEKHPSRYCPHYPTLLLRRCCLDCNRGTSNAHRSEAPGHTCEVPTEGPEGFERDEYDLRCSGCVALRISLDGPMLPIAPRPETAWPTTDEGTTHTRLTRIVDENLGYRPTAPIEALLSALETELPKLREIKETIEELSAYGHFERSHGEAPEDPRAIESLKTRVRVLLGSIDIEDHLEVSALETGSADK